MSERRGDGARQQRPLREVERDLATASARAAEANGTTHSATNKKSWYQRRSTLKAVRGGAETESDAGIGGVGASRGRAGDMGRRADAVAPRAREAARRAHASRSAAELQRSL